MPCSCRERTAASYPFWSPDGANIGFFANGKLQRVPSSGGPPKRLATVLSARGGSWGTKDVIIYPPTPGSAIWRVNPDGSGAAVVTDISSNPQLDETHRYPVFLPDGNHFIYWSGNFGTAKDDRYSGIYLGSLNGKEKKLVVLCRSKRRPDAWAA